MPRFGVTGYSTTICEELRRAGHETVRIGGDLGAVNAPLDPGPPELEFFILAAGVLVGRAGHMQSSQEIAAAIRVNYLSTVRLCEAILASRPRASVVIIGSQSAERGSFDAVYALSKLGIHHYVTTRGLVFPYRLNCVSPGIIADSGMTRRRHDYPGVLTSRATVTAKAVADTAAYVATIGLSGNNGVHRVIC